MGLPKISPIFTVDQYLDYERDAESRHEFLDGTVYAMAGESPKYSSICYNLYGLTHAQLRGKSCRGFSPNMKIAIDDKGLFAYPDLAIVCGEPIFHDKKQDVLLNPKVIFEVLSPSTASYDRGEKFLRYTNNIETLNDYILISQHEPLIEHFERQTDNSWLKTEITGLENILTINSIDCEIPLSELYYLINFEK